MYIDPFMLILQIISFLVLLGLLFRFLYKPFMKYLDERRESIRRLVEDAEQDRKRAEEHLEKSKEELRKAKGEVLHMKEHTAREADRDKIKTIEDAKKEALAIIEKAEGDIKREIEAAKENLRKDISTLSVEIAKKILDREVKEDDHKRLIKEALGKINKARQ